MKKYHIRSLPTGFSTLAGIALNALDGNLYAVGGKLVLTDEADDLGSPRDEVASFEELEDWLIRCIADWTAEGKDDPMFEALEENLKKLI